MSILDSFLLALITALQRPEDSELDAQSPRRSKDEVLDWDAVMAFLRAVADGAEYATSSLGRLFFNAILARRDLLLSSSTISPSARSSLRAQPLDQEALFGPFIGTTVKDCACGQEERLFHSSALPGQSFQETSPLFPAFLFSHGSLPFSNQLSLVQAH